MKNFKIMIAVVVGVVLAMSLPVLADTTLVRGRAYDVGGTPPSWAFGDVQPVGSDGINIEQVVGTLDDWQFQIAVDMDYINANITGSWLTAVVTDDPVSGTGTLLDPVTVGDNAIDDTHIDWGLGAGQVNSGDMPLSGSNTTEVLFNDAGYAAGDADFYWNKTTNVLTVSNGGASISIDGVNDTITASSGGISFDTTKLYMYPTTIDDTKVFQISNATVAEEVFSINDLGDVDVNGVLDVGEIVGGGASQQWKLGFNYAVLGYDDDGTLTANIFSNSSGGGAYFMNDAGTEYWLLDIDNGMIINDTSTSTCDTRIETDNYTNALVVDASANCVSIVPTEYIGDADTAGNELFADGSGNYLNFEVQAMTSDYGLAYPAVAPSLNQVPYATGATTPSGAYILAWQTPPWSLYSFKTIDCTSGTDPVADAADDTLTITAGTGITVTGNSTSDTVTIASTITDTDTDTNTYALCWDDSSVITLDNAADQGITAPHCVVQAGTAVYAGVYISRWSPDLTNIDVVTVTLYVDGVAKDSWTTEAGVVGSYGGAVSEALVLGHNCEVKAMVTTVDVGLDTIQIECASVKVQVL